jgi:DHA2 family multidrug resistance protein
VAPALRTEAASVFTLIRSVGSGIGISVITAIQLNNIGQARSSLAEHVRPDNPLLQTPAGPYDVHTQAGLTMFNAEVGRQAGMIAYIDAFYLTAGLCLACIPMLLLVRAPRRAGKAAEPAHAVMD